MHPFARRNVARDSRIRRLRWRSRRVSSCASSFPRKFDGAKDPEPFVLPSTFFLLGREVLQKLRDTLVQALHIFFLIAAGVQRLGRLPAPNELLRRRIVEIDSESAIRNRRTGRGTHSAPTQTAAHAPGVPLALLVYRALVTDVQVGLVASGQRESLAGEHIVYGIANLLGHDLVGMDV